MSDAQQPGAPSPDERTTDSRIPDQPIGEPTTFTGATRPHAHELRGRYVLLRPLQPERDAASLYPLTHAPTGDESVWTYLFDGPSASPAGLAASLTAQAASTDPLFFAICPLTGGTDTAAANTPHTGHSNAHPAPTTGAGEPPALGEAALMSIVPEHGTIEIGHVLFAPPLQRTRAATEAIYLLAREAFDGLGYRRLEWKCDSLNAPSRSAALRYGFRYEGTFAQHRVYKGRSRDTAWFAITDVRWPAVRAALERWLAPESFDEQGTQLTSLRDHMPSDHTNA